jgi:F0F1-type ATP synthase alpha subunit
MDTQHADIGEVIREKGQLNADLEKRIKAAIEDFLKTFQA